MAPHCRGDVHGAQVHLIPMTILARLSSFLRNTFHRRGVDARLDSELDGYVDLLADELRATGITHDEARRRARVAVGGVQQVKEAVRAHRAGAWLDSLRQELRFCLRGLRRAPMFTGTTVLTLGLGIGSTLAVLRVADAVLIKPLNYRASDRLVVVLPHGSDPVSPLNFLDWRRSMRSFSELEAAEAWSPTFTDGDPEQVPGLHITPGLIGLLGATPILGRTFSTTNPLSPTRELLLGYSVWQRRFGGDSSVIGRAVNVSGVPFIVAGVMGPEFRFAPFWATDAQVWAPLPLDGRLDDRDGSSLRVFGRLAATVSIDEAQHEVDAVTARINSQFPHTSEDVRVVPLREKAIGTARPALFTLLGAVLFVVLITCVNVAHMLVARAAAHQREVALRVVLGASRRHVMQRAFTESAILAISGTALGFAVATTCLRFVAVNGPPDLPQLRGIGIDGRLWVIAAVIAVATSVVVGLLPALLAGESARFAALRESSRGSTASRSRHRLRQLLIATEIAFAVVLLTGTALTVRTFSALRAIDPGFEAANVITMQVPLAESVGGTPAQRVAYFTGILDAVRAAPNVRGASMINHLPLAGDEWGIATYGGTTAAAPPSDALRTVYRVVLPGYFATMHIGLTRGRDIGQSDDLDHPSVVVINERLAKKLWPGQDAIGKQLTFAGPGGPRPMETVIGIARDTKQSQWTAAADPEVYRPYMQARDYLSGPLRGTGYLTVVARVAGDPASLVSAVRQMVRHTDPTLPVTHVEALPVIVARMTVRARFLMTILLGFALLAVTLAAIGIYGVMSHSVTERRQEIGIRVALGATNASVMRTVVDQAVVIASVGVVAGLALSVVLTRVISAQLYGVGALDPASFAAAVIALGLVAVIASVVPVRRALHLDPLTAIRND
jgi:predicted permease